MEALRVRVEVARQTAADHLAVGVHAIVRIRHQDVPPGAARDPVDALVVLRRDAVVSPSGRDRVGPGPADQHVGARGSQDPRDRGGAGERASAERCQQQEAEEAGAHGPERIGRAIKRVLAKPVLASERVPAPSRLSQAISEGDGISLIVEVDGAESAAEAERAGAKAVVLGSEGGDARPVRAATSLPLIVHGDDTHGVADACIITDGADSPGAKPSSSSGSGRTSSCRRSSSATTPRSCCSRRATRGSSRCSSCWPTCRPESWRSACSGRRPTTSWPSSSGPAATPSSSVRSLPRPDRRWLALGGLLLLAAALRIPGLRYGLPFPLLNPDEESIVPRAWAIGHGDGLDPGWYDYPSLLFYLLAPLEALVSEPSYGVARALAAAVGIVGVGAAWWLGRVAYGEAAALVAGSACAVATVHVAYSHMAVTDVLLTAGVTVTLALLVADRLEWAGVAAGLAVSAKYPGVFLAVPLLLAGWRRWRRLIVAAALAAAAFVVTSPFVVVHAGAAWDDISRVQRLARAGWLGFEHDHARRSPFSTASGRAWARSSSSRSPASRSPWETLCFRNTSRGSGGRISCSARSSSSTSCSS